MPYIKKDRRDAVDYYVDKVVRGENSPAGYAPQDCGELNYAFTMTCLQFSFLSHAEMNSVATTIAREYLMDPANPLRYQRINDVAGALECAALEIERRGKKWLARNFATLLRNVFTSLYIEIGVPYEIAKIEENGDIAAYKGV